MLRSAFIAILTTAWIVIHVHAQILAAGAEYIYTSSSIITDDRTLDQKWGYDWGFSGISTFGHLPHIRCLTHPDERFDIGVLGIPFDTSVSFRPGARFGPRAIRAASLRHLIGRGFNTQAQVNPYTSWARIFDCGDIPVTPFDNAVAMDQMTQALTELGMRKSAAASSPKPKLLLLGGDHLVALPALRALKAVYGKPVALLHFDAHLDTLHPDSFPNSWHSAQSDYNHASVFWHATREGLLANGSNVHVGTNTRLTGMAWNDYEDDDSQGFLRIGAEAIETIGAAAIVERIRHRIGDNPVYLSVDIDVLDPAFAPGTGAPEPGGWTTRELMKVLRGLGDINLVGADIVEVAPQYDSNGQDTAFVAACLGYEILTLMIKQGLKLRGQGDNRGADNALQQPVLRMKTEL